MNRVDSKKGFTIVELMLAMIFVSALLLMVAATVIQISNIYNRGLLLKSVNESATKIIDSLKQGISNGSSFDVDSNSSYINSDDGGRLCTGGYSYIWNYGNALNKGDSGLNVYSNSSNKIRLVKIADPSGSYCSDASGDYQKIDSTKAMELLDGSDMELVLYSFSISAGASNNATNQALYTIKFRLGTMDESLTKYGSCEIGSVTDMSYCYVNDFDILVRVGGQD